MSAIDKLVGGGNAPSGGSSAVDTLVNAPRPVTPPPAPVAAPVKKKGLFSKIKDALTPAPRPADISAPAPTWGQKIPAPKPVAAQRPTLDLGSAIEKTADFIKGDPDKNFALKDALYNRGRGTDAYSVAAPEQKIAMQREQEMEAPALRFLNSPIGKKITGKMQQYTSNLPLKAVARLQSLGDKTYEEARNALLTERNDPTNPAWQRLMYSAQDAIPQSAIGALLAIGTSLATRSATAGRTVGAAYFAPISAEQQRQDKGEVTSVGNIAIDTAGDIVIGSFAENALKSIIKGGARPTLQAIGQGAAIEGFTEPTQTLLKYANDYKNAKTPEERSAIVAKTTEYVKSGAILEEALVGAMAGGVITGGAALAGRAGNALQESGGPSLVSPLPEAPSRPPKREEEGATEPVKRSAIDELVGATAPAATPTDMSGGFDGNSLEAAGYSKSKFQSGYEAANVDGTRRSRIFVPPPNSLKTEIVASRTFKYDTNLTKGNSSGDKRTYKTIEEAVAGENEWLGKSSSPSLPKELEGLAAEARKYKSAEEFIGKMKGSSTQYGDYAPHTREYLPDDFKNITELGIDPEETVTIYRGIDKMTRKGPRKINDGDFVTSDFDSAASYAGKDNVVSMEVKAKYLYNDNARDFVDDPFYIGSEYVYSTKKIKPLPSDKELTDFFNKVKGNIPSETPAPSGDKPQTQRDKVATAVRGEAIKPRVESALPKLASSRRLACRILAPLPS